MLPVIKRYDQLLRTQRRGERKTLGDIKSTNQNDALRMFAAASLKETKTRRRTFDGTPSPSQSLEVLPAIRTPTTTQSAPTSRTTSRPISPIFVRERRARKSKEEDKGNYDANAIVEAGRAQLLASEDSILPKTNKQFGKLFARLVRCLGTFLLALRRVRSTAIVCKFLTMRRATSKRRVLSQKIKRVLGMILRVQKAWRAAVVCKRAKMKVVANMWDAEERVFVRTLWQTGQRTRHSMQVRGPAMSIGESRREKTVMTEHDGKWCFADIESRWKRTEERFKEFDSHQAHLSKALLLPKQVKTQFARRYVEEARRTHLEQVKDHVKEEVTRLRLRVLYTTEDAKSLLEPGQGVEGTVERLRMRLVLQNMTSSAALTAYKQLKDERLRGGQSTDDDDGHLALLLAHFHAPRPTFFFYTRLWTRAQKGHIQGAVRTAHTADRRPDSRCDNSYKVEPPAVLTALPTV